MPPIGCSAPSAHLRRARVADDPPTRSSPIRPHRSLGSLRARRRRTRPDDGRQGITSGYIRSRPPSPAAARRRLSRRRQGRERAPRHLTRRTRSPARRRSPTSRSWKRQPRRERRGDGRAAPRRAPAGGRQKAHRRRGARPRTPGVRRARRAERSGRPLDKTRCQLTGKAWDRGAIVYARGQVVRLAPPLCIHARKRSISSWTSWRGDRRAGGPSWPD